VSDAAQERRIAFIGTVGVPNRYGGFEAFLEHCGPTIAGLGPRVTITCFKGAYEDRSAAYRGVHRVFVPIPANGALSVLHDLCAFAMVFPRSTHIVVLGVSGGPWFPMFRLLCDAFGKTLVVNVDGVEWMRGKFSAGKRRLLKWFDEFAQRCSHVVIYDNAALRPFLSPGARRKSHMIAYPGDHVLRVNGAVAHRRWALTICRIEPENNVSMLIQGALASRLERYTVIGNWRGSSYGRDLRARYADEPRLRLMDPVYDPVALAEHREAAGVYLHGHSVGGTNPSLVEMLFYDSRILCFDVAFHRETAGDCAEYFQDAAMLASLLDAPRGRDGSRLGLRHRYSSTAIARAYLAAMTAGPSATPPEAGDASPSSL
jgi:hypothetical protein